MKQRQRWFRADQYLRAWQWCAWVATWDLVMNPFEGVAELQDSDVIVLPPRDEMEDE
jgi:hypothetical protein